jgi:hypothetical protein
LLNNSAGRVGEEKVAGFYKHGNEPSAYSLASNFRRVLNAVFFLLGDSPASEFYVPTFRNTLFHLHRWRKQEEVFGLFKSNA